MKKVKKKKSIKEKALSDFYDEWEAERKRDEMKRFHKQPMNANGQVIIVDILNTEPVCCIYAQYHPYAPEIIYRALQDYQKKMKRREDEKRH